MREELVSKTVERAAAFKLAGSEFAMPISSIQEVFSASYIIDIPLAPPFMNRIINSRGRIITIFDLTLFLFSKVDTYDKESRVILLQAPDMNIGIAVEKIMRIEFIAENSIEELTDDEKKEKVFIFTRGVLRSEYTDRIVNIIDCEKILTFCREYQF